MTFPHLIPTTLRRPPPPHPSRLFRSRACLVGFLIVNIVGLRCYSGRISGRELVGLKIRKPLTSFEPNAVKVLNIRHAQVDHVEHSVATVLSPSSSTSVSSLTSKPSSPSPPLTRIPSASPANPPLLPPLRIPLRPLRRKLLLRTPLPSLILPLRLREEEGDENGINKLMRSILVNS